MEGVEGVHGTNNGGGGGSRVGSFITIDAHVCLSLTPKHYLNAASGSVGLAMSSSSLKRQTSTASAPTAMLSTCPLRRQRRRPLRPSSLKTSSSWKGEWEGNSPHPLGRLRGSDHRCKRPHSAAAPAARGGSASRGLGMSGVCEADVWSGCVERMG